MSDDDFMAQSDDEEYDFDYDSDDDGSDAGAADLENLYYNAKQDKEDDPENALQGFERLSQLNSLRDSGDSKQRNRWSSYIYEWATPKK